MQNRRAEARVRWPAAAALMVSVAGAAGHASAQAAAPADDPVVLERSLYKTLVFEAGTNALDLALFAGLLG